MNERFSTIAADYMRIGDELKIRWDIAFFQMMLETGNLTFKGDVQANQNNFAGLGATGKHVPGESFPDVATGVKAHLQHLLLYAGEHLDNPVAERTPIGRTVTMLELSEAALFLLENGAVNGINLAADGGWTLK